MNYASETFNSYVSFNIGDKVGIILEMVEGVGNLKLVKNNVF